ncbi:MAG: hypothetical protein JST68_06665 [Bacteroidetes bacterium]|nr:hypothetical protein [Bacteroidota bacterium]
MGKILYRSEPRLLVLVFTGLGSIFFGLLSWITYLGYRGGTSYIVLIPGVLFLIGSIWSFCLFVTIRVVKLSEEAIEFSFLLLPIRRTYPIKDVKRIFQKSRNVEVVRGFLTPLTFPYIVTCFEMGDNKVIKMNSIGSLDFEQLENCFNKVTRGNGQYFAPKKTLAGYVLDNWQGSAWVLLVIVVTIGLALALIKGQALTAGI